MPSLFPRLLCPHHSVSTAAHVAPSRGGFGVFVGPPGLWTRGQFHCSVRATATWCTVVQHRCPCRENLGRRGGLDEPMAGAINELFIFYRSPMMPSHCRPSWGCLYWTQCCTWCWCGTLKGCGLVAMVSPKSSTSPCNLPTG